MSGSFIQYEDFKSTSALSGFVGSLPNKALINIETIVEGQMTPTFRVWYYNVKIKK